MKNPALKTDIGLLLIRLSVGIPFALVHGLEKLEGGKATWDFLGGTMAYIGIHFAPTFWGFLAMLAEFGGGICMLLGVAVRPAAVAMLFTMVMAIIMHVNKGNLDAGHKETIGVYIGCLLCLLIAGGGKLGIAGLIKRR